MRRPKALLSVAGVLVVLVAIVVGAIAIAGSSGGDDGKTGTPATTPDAPGGSAAPSGGLGRFPPQFIQCLKDRGVDVESLEGEDLNEVFHGGAVPPEVLNACFGVLHGGGGAP